MKQQLMMLLLGTASVLCSCETQIEQHEKNELRAPAYPLVTIDPIPVHGLLRTISMTVL